MEAKLGPSWSQVGPYKGAEWHVKVTSKLSCFLSKNVNFGPPQGVRSGVGLRLWRHGNIAFWNPKCTISIKRNMQNRAGVCAGKKSPKGDFLPN